MKSSRIIPFVVVVLLSVTALFGAEKLGVGSKAPELDLDKIATPDGKEAKGKMKFADIKSKVIVVEFWATWCGPCRASIPHLSGLQEKYGDKVAIIGVSIDQGRDEVVKFHKANKDKMKYIVAFDARGSMNKNYLKAEGARGIPHAYIIVGGKIFWSGHPGSMDESLEKAVKSVKGDNDVADKDGKADEGDGKVEEEKPAPPVERPDEEWSEPPKAKK